MKQMKQGTGEGLASWYRECEKSTTGNVQQVQDSRNVQQEQKRRATGDTFWAEMAPAGMEKHPETSTSKEAEKEPEAPLSAPVNLKITDWPEHEQKKHREPFWAEMAPAHMQKRAEKASKNRQKGDQYPPAGLDDV